MKCGVVGIGAPGRIRTCTVLLLREPPPAVGLLAHLWTAKEWFLEKKWCLISAFTRVFNALWGVDRTRGLPHTKRLLNQRSFEGIVR
jgi:hypothetical protein